MPSLRDLQERFYDAVTSANVDALAGCVRPNAICASARIEVYRNNAREGSRKALLADYPVIEQLAGPECFRGLARAYLCQHPSRSGDLQDFGREFSAFLARRYSGSEFDYFTDVARLEWACQEALVAGDASPIGVERLAGIAPEHLERVRLQLHPATRLVRSQYPILRIWQQHQAGADPQARIDLRSGEEAVLVRRLHDGIELRLLHVAEWSFLAALCAGGTLGSAVDAGLAADNDFDLTEVLGRAFARGLVIGCTRPGMDLAELN